MTYQIAASRKVQIVSRRGTSRVLLFSFDVPADVASGMEMRAALEAATSSGANLRGADLRGANLRDADLGDANLRDADLRGADLRGANLRGADLRDANLGAANLRGANLGGANLGGADLGPIKTDFFDVLLRAPREIPALRAALVDGKVDGSCYEGSCACLVGTIANARGVGYRELGAGIKPNSSRPIESFFMSIRRGDVPATNQAAGLCLEWLDEFSALLAAALNTTPHREETE